MLAQDFTDYELVISDNASTDNSVAVISEFARQEPRIRFTQQRRNLGMVANFNWCLAQARGEYIKFLLADDKLTRPDSLRRLVTMLERDPKCALASSSAQIINERSEVQSVRDFLGGDAFEEGPEICRRCLLSGINQIGEPSLTLFRRQSVSEGFNEAYRLWVDVEFFLRVLEHGLFAYCAEPLTAFRVHPDQETHRHLKEHLLQTEHYQLLVQFADRPWLGRKRARERLFEEQYRSSKGGGFAPPVQCALNQALGSLGHDGYATFKIRRRFLRPITKLRHSVRKRVWTRRSRN